jgi:hypothetical protein
MSISNSEQDCQRRQIENDREQIKWLKETLGEQSTTNWKCSVCGRETHYNYFKSFLKINVCPLFEHIYKVAMRDW